MTGWRREERVEETCREIRNLIGSGSQLRQRSRSFLVASSSVSSKKMKFLLKILVGKFQVLAEKKHMKMVT